MKKIIIVCLAVCLLLCGIAGIPEAKAEAGVHHAMGEVYGVLH